MSSNQVTFRIHLLQGRNLAVKDRNSSDPFVRIYAKESDGIEDYLFQSRSKSATLNPKFNEKYDYTLQNAEVESTAYVMLRLFDDDAMHGEDPLGTVRLPLKLDTTTESEWYPVEKGEGEFACENASGELQIKLEML